MRVQMSCLLVVGMVAALAAPAWASDKKSAQAPISTCANPSYQDAGVSAPSAAWPGPDGFGYTGSTCTYSWVDISGTGTAITGLVDDNFMGPFPIGFGFSYYGSTQTAFYASSNGFISFGGGNAAYTNQCPLPNATTPDSQISMLWDDLNFSTSGTAHYQTFASCPVGSGQCLVVQYSNTAYFGGAAGSAGTWEAILFGNGVVKMQYLAPGTNAGSGSTTGIEGANFAAGHGLTYACNTAASISANLCIEIGTLPGVSLSPDPLLAAGCGGQPQTHTMQLFNNTGTNGVFDMTYAVTLGAATLTGPPQVIATAGATVPFHVVLTPTGLGAQTVNATVTATGNTYTDTATIVKNVIADGSGAWAAIATEPNSGRMDNVAAAYARKVWSVAGYGLNANVRSYDPVSDAWTTVASSAPPFGVTYARSGCTAGSKVFIYGDAATAGFTGLWSYNMATNVWTNEAPTGTPPPYTGIWAPSWVADAATGLCYMTGGATVPGAGNLATVYVYDPVGNAWLAPLPNFTSVRDFHAAYIFNRASDGDKLLCVAGGNNGAGMTSTQCYDFTSAAWNAENAELGALTMGDYWGMGYTQKTAGAARQLWMTGGIIGGGGPFNAAWYYDTATGTWVNGGPMFNVGVYRTAATTLNNEVYRLGGSTGGFTYTGLADRNQFCTDVIFADGFQTP